MAETDNMFTITTTHYRQLDFLRLFRLARGLGLVKRKRKMPSDYTALDDNEKTQGDSRSACRRLLRMILQHVYPEFTISSNWNHYFLSFPQEHKDTLTFLLQNFRHIEASTDKETVEAVSYYREMMLASGLIAVALPYQIKVRLSNIRPNTRSNSYQPIRPRESFYQCAIESIRYKELLDKCMPVIIKVVNAHKVILEEQRRLRQDIRKMARQADIPAQTVAAQTTMGDSLIVPTPTVSSEGVGELVANIQVAREERLKNAQSIFDQALAKFLQEGER